MNQLFNIFQVNEEDAKKIESSSNEPHNHDFEELIIGISGELEHFIDFKTETFTAPFISFVTKGKVHRVKGGRFPAGRSGGNANGRYSGFCRLGRD